MNRASEEMRMRVCLEVGGCFTKKDGTIVVRDEPNRLRSSALTLAMMASIVSVRGY